MACAPRARMRSRLSVRVGLFMGRAYDRSSSATSIIDQAYCHATTAAMKQRSAVQSPTKNPGTYRNATHSRIRHRPPLCLDGRGAGGEGERLIPLSQPSPARGEGTEYLSEQHP